MSTDGRIGAQFSGDPNGSVTARLATLGWDFTNKVLYVNDDGVTSWTIAGSIITTGGIMWTVNTPADIAANQNNYDPGDAVIIRLNPTGTDRDITGLNVSGGNNDGRILLLQNINTLNDVILKDQDGSSVAANQFLTGVGDISLSPNDAVLVWYDATTTKWRAALGI